MVEEINGERMWLLADGTVPLLLPPGTDKVGGLRQIQNACDAYFTACVPIPVEWLTVLADVLHCKEKYTPLPLEV
ncbi:hypothetical protein AGDE_13096 [Angomonas deanei]|nr:hypothetical protein AGDE_13096 [Angomonas deanei]|eukprot:EPY22736.1 hypothetical protein AGDE_13096 [Angomonas deanei]